MKQRYEAAWLYARRHRSLRPPPQQGQARSSAAATEEIDVACQLIENMGRLGIPVWCYEWMTDFNWLRTNKSTPRARRLGRDELQRQ